MLIQFRFKNFKSFKDETILDLSSTKITENSESVISFGSEKLLKIAAIYGANASGKSGIYDAFEYMSYYVIRSFSFDNDVVEKDGDAFIKPKPFKFSEESRQQPSEFEVYFSKIGNDGKIKIYNYGFVVDEYKIHEEWLNVKSVSGQVYKNIFYRENNQFDCSLPQKQITLIHEGITRETLAISLGAKFKIEPMQEVRKWFLDNETLDFASLPTNVYLYRNIPEGFDNDERVRQNIVRFFSSFDKSIKGFEVEENTREDEKENVTFTINSLHKMIDSNKYGEIPLKDESAGTLKMFSIYPFLLEVIEKGSVLFIDELNARLHPLLVRNIILLFLNKELNPKNAQLIFTTHDSWQLSTGTLRRDEIWFVEKNKEGCSSLYSLADFKGENGVKIRKDENFEKNYMVGNYGAIPTLENLILKGENISE